MEFWLLLLLAAYVWYSLVWFADKSEKNAKRNSRVQQPNQSKANAPTPMLRFANGTPSQPPYAKFESVKNDANLSDIVIDEDGNSTYTIRGDQVDIQKIMHENALRRKHWSGVVNGQLPLKSLTDNQGCCLGAASLGDKVVGLPPSQMYSQQPKGTCACANKTVNSLVKHGMLESDGNGGYAITDLGL